MTQLFFASGNPGKVRELRELLSDINIVSLIEHPLDMPPETEETFEGNALAKARFVSQTLGISALGDDSGLVIDALGGAPGVYSARYAEGTDMDRCQAVLNALGDNKKRTARFVCAMAWVKPKDEEGKIPAPIVVTGRCEGSITHAPSGTNGFGYDPIFALQDGRIMAELSSDEKNLCSHRARALQLIVPYLRGLI